MTSCPLRALLGGPDDVGTDREVFDLLNMHRACDKVNSSPSLFFATHPPYLYAHLRTL